MVGGIYVNPFRMWIRARIYYWWEFEVGVEAMHMLRLFLFLFWVLGGSLSTVQEYVLLSIEKAS